MRSKMAEKKNKRKKWPVAVGIAGVVVVAVAVTDTRGGVAGKDISQLVLTILNAVFTDYHFAISLSVGGLALGFSVGVGLIFGIYPANKAAKLKPINALRYE